MANDVASIGIEFKTDEVVRGIRTLDELIALGPKVERSVDGVSKSSSSLTGKLKELWGSMTKGGEVAKSTSANVDELSASMRSVTSTATLAARGIQAVVALSVVGWAKDSAGALFAASAAAERLKISLDFASSSGSISELMFLRKLTDDLGLSFSGTANAYQQFQAAARGTSLEGQKARDVFESISKASAVMGLSTEQSAGVLLALQQMVSKGTVQAEELRGQLGERLPGAFQIAARSMGVTTAELGKMLKKGEVIATDFLPRFAKQLEESVGDAAEKAANRLDASVNRMGNAWERFKQRVGDSGISQQMATEAKALTKHMDAMSESMDAAKASGGGMWQQLGSAAWSGGVRGVFSVAESSANALNYAINALTGNLFGLYKLSTNVSILPDSFKTTAEQVQILSAKLKDAEDKLAHLQSLGGQFGNERWYTAEIQRAQGVANEYRQALSAKQALTGEAGANPADAYMKFPTRSQSYANFAQQQAASEKALQEMRMRSAGISQQYFKDMNSLQEGLKLGTLKPDAYIKEMSDLAKRTYDSSTAGKDAKKGASGAKSAASLAERMNAAATSLDLSAIAKKYEELTSIYSGSEQILETLRRSGIMSEQEFYASKIQFVNLNIDAKKRELEEENKVLQAQNATGVRDINRDKKIADNQAKINKLAIEAAMQTENLGLQAKAAEAAQVGQFTAARQAAEDYLEVLQRGFDRDVAAVGMSDNERNIANGRNQIKDKYADQRRDFDNQRELARVNAGGTLSADIAKFYQDKIDLSRVYEDQALKSYTVGVAGRLAAEGEWVIGAGRAFKNYSDTAANVAQQTADLFSNAFKGMEDSLVNFAMTGKLDFKSLADSIIADLIRIQARAAISNMFGGGSGGGGLLGSIVSGVSSLFGGGAATGAATGAGTMSALQGLGAFDGGGYTGDGGKYQPAGIVHKGEYVINAESTKRIGLGLLSRLNGYANGGLVGGATAVVGAGIGGGTEINIHNYSGAPVEQRQSTGADGKVIVDLFIGEAASQLANGYGLMDQAMRARKNQGM